MSKEIALAQLNQLEESLKLIIRTAVEAQGDDGRIDVGEGLDLGVLIFQLTMQIRQLVRRVKAQGGEDLLYVLENSRRVLDGSFEM